MKLIVPAYFYPGVIWDTLLSSKLDAISDVIINPKNGSGKFDLEYLRLCTRLRKAGVGIFGYVSTRYGKRPISEIREDIESYAWWYGVWSIFLDEVASGKDMLSFYRGLYDSINGKVVLNHGIVPHEDYLDAGDVLVVGEDEPSKLKDKKPIWVRDNRAKICQIVVNCPAKDMPFALAKVSATARYVYITNDVEPNPYDTLPKYWNELVKAMN